MQILELVKLQLELTKQVSNDESKQTSSVIFNSREILLVNSNTFTKGIDSRRKELQERPIKYSYIEHSERNVIYDAARNGLKLEGLSMACSWFPCADCARAIVQSGIKYLYYSEEGVGGGMDYGFDAAREILEKGKVKLIKLQH